MDGSEHQSIACSHEIVLQTILGEGMPEYDEDFLYLALVVAIRTAEDVENCPPHAPPPRVVHRVVRDA